MANTPTCIAIAIAIPRKRWSSAPFEQSVSRGGGLAARTSRVLTMPALSNAMDPPTPRAIEVEALAKRYGEVEAVRGLSLTVAPGEVFGFLGPNGAGKSTTIRLLLGLIRPNAGIAQVFGISSGDVGRAHQHLAYVPADVALWPSLTGAEILELLGNVGPGVDIAYRAELVER